MLITEFIKRCDKLDKMLNCCIKGLLIIYWNWHKGNYQN